MCIEKIDLEKTKELQNSKEKIIAYKLLNLDMTSIFKNFRWNPGLNISDRESTDLTKEELNSQEVHSGFHFFLDKPKTCQYQCRCPYRCRYRYRCRYPYRCQCRYNTLIEYEIDPKDIVGVGLGSLDTLDIVATKATMIKKT